MRQRFWIVALILVTVLLVSLLVVPTMHVTAQEPNAGWEEVSAGSASGGGISNNGYSCCSSLAVASDGTVYIAWSTDIIEDNNVYVLRWNGTIWEDVGTPIPAYQSRTDLSVAIAPDGTPYIAWEIWVDTDLEIYVRRWNGSYWLLGRSGDRICKQWRNQQY